MYYTFSCTDSIDQIFEPNSEDFKGDPWWAASNRHFLNSFIHNM